MTRTACALLVIGTVWLPRSVSQAAVGGPSKSQSYIGGPAPQINPVVPSQRGQATKPGQSRPKPSK